VVADFLDVVMTYMVFYDCQPRLSGRDAMRLIDEVVNLLGQKPSKVHVAVVGKERRPLYNAALRQAADGSFEGYDYLEAATYVEKGDISSLKLSVCSRYGAIWGDNFESAFSLGFVEAKSQKVDPRDVIRLLAKYQMPGSGIYYRMPFKWGPGWFGSTVINLGLPRALQDRQQEFVEEYREGRQRQGRIRDLFSYNVLSDVHLRAQIEGTTLRAWIEDRMKRSVATMFGQTRGVLEQVVDGVWLWSLTDDEIQRVRPTVLKAKLLMVKA
jgi:hypothetical protein